MILEAILKNRDQKLNFTKDPYWWCKWVITYKSLFYRSHFYKKTCLHHRMTSKYRREKKKWCYTKLVTCSESGLYSLVGCSTISNGHFFKFYQVQKKLCSRTDSLKTNHGVLDYFEQPHFMNILRRHECKITFWLVNVPICKYATQYKYKLLKFVKLLFQPFPAARKDTLRVKSTVPTKLLNGRSAI